MKLLYRWVVGKLIGRVATGEFTELVGRTLEHRIDNVSTPQDAHNFTLGAMYSARIAEAVLHNQAHSINQLRREAEILLNTLERSYEYASSEEAAIIEHLLNKLQERLFFFLDTTA